MLAVRADGLPPDARVQPAMEDAATRAQRRVAAFRGRPGDAEARLVGRPIGYVSLIAVADARAQGQAFLHADVVLEIRARAGVKEVQVGVADAARVEQRRARLVRVEAAEHVC